MNCYVLGAGVSKSVGYPLGSELFDQMDSFVRESGACFDRFDYRKDWDRLDSRLKSSRLESVSARALMPLAHVDFSVKTLLSLRCWRHLIATFLSGKHPEILLPVL